METDGEELLDEYCEMIICRKAQSTYDDIHNIFLDVTIFSSSKSQIWIADWNVKKFGNQMSYHSCLLHVNVKKASLT